MMKKKLILSSVIVLAFLISLQPVEAQIYFGITPIRVEHSLNKGESITDIFYVRNNGTFPLRIKIFPENWYLGHNGNPVFVGSNSVDYSCRDWIKVNPQDFRIMPDEIKMVRYTITVPEDIPQAGYHASISFENVPMSVAEKDRSQMVFSGKIAAAVYVKVGKVDIVGEIIDLILHEEDNSHVCILVIKNRGKTHFRTQGSIEISDNNGKKVLDVMIPNEVVLPESEREIKCKLNGKLSAGKYTALCTLDIGREELLGFKKEILIQDEK